MDSLKWSLSIVRIVSLLNGDKIFTLIFVKTKNAANGPTLICIINNFHEVYFHEVHG